MPGEKPAQGPAEPQPQTGDADTEYTVGCVWQATSNEVVLVWGPAERAAFEQKEGPGLKPIEIDGRPGMQATDLDSSGALRCIAKVDMGESGVFGVIVRERETNPGGEQQACLVATNLATVVAGRTA